MKKVLILGNLSKGLRDLAVGVPGPHIENHYIITL